MEKVDRGVLAAARNGLSAMWSYASVPGTSLRSNPLSLSANFSLSPRQSLSEGLSLSAGLSRAARGPSLPALQADNGKAASATSSNQHAGRSARGIPWEVESMTDALW